MSENIYSAKTLISKNDRALFKNHRSYCIWITGLSASGKSTTANALELELNKQGVHTYLLDGDNILISPLTGRQSTSLALSLKLNLNIYLP